MLSIFRNQNFAVDAIVWFFIIFFITNYIINIIEVNKFIEKLKLFIKKMIISKIIDI